LVGESTIATHGYTPTSRINLNHFVGTGSQVYQRTFSVSIEQLLFITDGISNGLSLEGPQEK
jgi:hypothetical protein